LNKEPEAADDGGVHVRKNLPDSSGRRRIRVVVADDCGLMRTSLCDLLRTLPSVEIVGVAADGIQAAYVCAAARPDLVLVDFAMPRLNGLEAAHALRRQCPGSRVVIVSNLAPLLAVSGPQPDVDAIIEKIDLPRELPAVIDRLFPGTLPAPASS